MREQGHRILYKHSHFGVFGFFGVWFWSFFSLWGAKRGDVYCLMDGNHDATSRPASFVNLDVAIEAAMSRLSQNKLNKKAMDA